MPRYFAALSLFSAALFAQEYRGNLLGRVTDPSGAAIPNATVSAVNVETRVATTGVSNEEGLYRVAYLIPGDYKVSVESTGFKKAELSQIRISVNANVTVDVKLEVGQSTESVTVSAEAPLLNTSNADVGQIIDRSFINVVNPSLTRNITNLAQLAPGVTGSTGTYTSAAQNNFSITGGGSTQGRNEFLVDGMPTSVPDGITFVPSMDSVAEVKVQTTLFDAQFGRSNGGALNITTKGGTNELHGVGYWFKRWRALNANSWNNNRLGLERPPVDYDQYGFLVSGPVFLPKLIDGRNKLFFSAAYEADSDARSLTRQARVPTTAERGGDFSQTRNLTNAALTIFDPATTVVTGNTATRQPFANNTIPSTRLDPTGRAVMATFPNPTDAAIRQLGAFNWASTGTYVVEQKNFNSRIDFNLSDKQRLFGRLGWLKRTQRADTLFPHQFEFPGFGGTDLDLLQRNFYTAALDDTITLSPSTVVSLRYGVTRRRASSQTGVADFDPSSLQLAPALLGNQTVRGFPVFRVAGNENLPALGRSFSGDTDNQHAVLATVNRIMGRHSFKFGSDYRNVRLHNVSPGGSAAGQFSFSTLFTRQDPFNPRSGDTTGTGMASMLLGIPDSGSLGYNSNLSMQSHYWALFFQDDWKITNRLTLNLGMRWELETPYTERYNRIAYGFDETAQFPLQVPGLNLRGGIRFAGVDGAPRTAGNTDWNNLGPRIGMAYSLTNKTVVRAGYGLFYASVINNTGFTGTLNTFNAQTQYVGTTDNATPFTSLRNPFPTGLQQPLGSRPGLAALAGDTLSFFNPNRVLPYNQQWTLSVQRQLPFESVLEVAYVGSHAVKQIESFNLNEIPDSFLPLGNAQNTQVPNPFRNIFPATSVLGTGANIAQNRLWPRFPQYTTLTAQGMNTGRGLYHSLQTNYNKRFSKGLSVLFIYTFSRLMDNNTTSVINPRTYRAVSEFDQKHVARLASTYQLPFRFQGSAAMKALDYVAGGWQINGLLTMATGTPLTVTHPNGRPLRLRNPALSGPVSERLGDRRNPNGTIANPYFDTGAFQAFPNQFVVTPEPPRLDELRAPGTFGLNASLFKTIPIRERVKMELRIESSGLTNTPIFNAPGTALNNAAQFGQINGAGGSRSMQGAIRLQF